MFADPAALPGVKQAKTEKPLRMPQESDLHIPPSDDTRKGIPEAPPPKISASSRKKEPVSLFKFSRSSLGVLMGRHRSPRRSGFSPVFPPLAEVVRLSIGFSSVDITVLSSTLRDLREQEAFVEAGTSRTMESLHLEQADGFIHAVDLGALERGKVSWRPEVYFDIAEAVQAAARELDIDIVWGGAWRNLNTDKSVYELHAEYIAEVAARPWKNGRPQRPFFDGPHFQTTKRDRAWV